MKFKLKITTLPGVNVLTAIASKLESSELKWSLPSLALQDYQATGLTALERESLIVEYLPHVRMIARRIRQRLPESVSLDDLISTGTLGLIAAVDRFDPTLNVKLKTYAEYKIRGAILDNLRGLDWASRQQRKIAKQIQFATLIIEQRIHRRATEEEISAELKMSLEQYHRWLVQIQGVNLGSLECAFTDDESDKLLNYISDDEENWPSRLAEKNELQKQLADAIEEIPPTERIVITRYYHEELTLREIAKIMNLHESRVSQLKSKAILRLRSSLKKAGQFKKDRERMCTLALVLQAGEAPVHAPIGRL